MAGEQPKTSRHTARHETKLLKNQKAKAPKTTLGATKAQARSAWPQKSRSAHPRDRDKRNSHPQQHRGVPSKNRPQDNNTTATNSKAAPTKLWGDSARPRHREDQAQKPALAESPPQQSAPTPEP
eukprot:TRINITY_DN19057_c0_g1_i1.p3 TRINITY_DN19057_c0_g1~~TRINITY_DN19057_c0_g1_i1.p3  ORF type:complete len:125 (-),score=3.12 TRINITY_DN19057_c0_g1_i1:787-1161(-)